MADDEGRLPVIPTGPGGKEFRVGRTIVTVAPLNLAAIRKHAAAIDALIDKFRDKTQQARFSDLLVIGPIVLASLRRNHPEVTQDWIDEWVDTSNARDLLFAVMTASVPPAGEAQAPADGGVTSTGAG